jgi:multidrug resistance efflux pump
VWGVIGAILLTVALYFGIPLVTLALNTVSTDDAYVNSYPTFVAPRVGGQVAKVLVVDDQRVKKGDLIVQLDKEPYQIQVEIKKAAVDVAQTNLNVAQAQVRSQVAQARTNRFKLEHAIEDVRNKVANLRAAVASYKSKVATRPWPWRRRTTSADRSWLPPAASARKTSMSAARPSKSTRRALSRRCRLFRPSVSIWDFPRSRRRDKSWPRCRPIWTKTIPACARL